MPVANLDKIDIYYEIHGTGQPIVLISGYASDHTYWNALVNMLAKKFQVLVFDNRAVGQTKDGNADFTLDLLAEDTIALINKLNIPQPHIVGHSMGGAIAQIVAKKYSDNVGKLIILNSLAKLNIRSSLVLENLFNMRKENVAIDLLIDSALPWLFSAEFLSNQTNVANYKNFLMANPYFQSLHDQARQLKALQLFDSTNWLHEIKNPALVLSSKEDILSLPSECEQLSKTMRHARFSTLPGGHSTPIEHPESVCQVVFEFFA